MIDVLQETLAGRDLISISDLSKEEIERILEMAQKELPSDLCRGSLLASLFFEPSTRTRLSFEAAMHRLGGQVIGVSEMANSSLQKGESLADSIRVISSYADLIVLRHPLEGAARLAADCSNKPIINAGDGPNQHPTQTLLDLYTILKTQGTLDGLSIAFAGDLKFGRTVHSLALALAHYKTRLYFISPDFLSLPEEIAQELRKKGVKFSFHSSFEELLAHIDLLYMTRLQRERFMQGALPSPFQLKKRHLERVKENFRILHPLPRLDEIEREIDSTPFAAYFQQAENALPVRMALLALLLGKI